MSDEQRDIIKHGLLSAFPITGSAITMDKFLTAVTIIFIVLQTIYLVRKWWREETDYGLKMRRWAEGKFTKPGDLQ